MDVRNGFRHSAVLPNKRLPSGRGDFRYFERGGKGSPPVLGREGGEVIRPGWISTYTGKAFYFDAATPESICIEDIAHALSNVCRFGGHSPGHFSVAQHSLLVASLCPAPLALTGLLHDATEAYIGDMVTPLKALFPEFKKREDRLWEVIAEKFGVCRVLPRSVHDADAMALSMEAKYLMGVDPADWGLMPAKGYPDFMMKWTPEDAEAAFLDEFRRLVESGGDPMWDESAAVEPKESILQEAQRLVHGDRGESYGHPIEDFGRTAKMWSAILGFEVPVEKVALCMVALKMSRQCNKPKRDNWTDMAGYAETGYMVDQAKGDLE